jgi:hypothetical protein
VPATGFTVVKRSEKKRAMLWAKKINLVAAAAIASSKLLLAAVNDSVAVFA